METTPISEATKAGRTVDAQRQTARRGWPPGKSAATNRGGSSPKRRCSARLMHYEMYVGQPLMSDDAGQFKILGLLHALCWLHAERGIRKLVPMSPREQEAVDGVRDAVWKYYQRLRTYRETPTLQRKAALERDFERLFRRRTGFADLNEGLRRIHEKRDDLLLVLQRPDVPMHNNVSECDIREWAKRRKISAGMRSELGRRCRDTFISLKKTCRKLGVSFWRYLQDRIRKARDILGLPELMRQAAQKAQPVQPASHLPLSSLAIARSASDHRRSLRRKIPTPQFHRVIENSHMFHADRIRTEQRRVYPYRKRLGTILKCAA